MHAPVWKRTNASQIIGLALALGLAASIALNVVMLTRSDDNQAASTGAQTGVELLAQQERYYSAKEVRQDAVEAAAGAQIAQSGALTASQQSYYDRKSDQLNGITSQSSTILALSQQHYVDLKSDQMDGIANNPRAASWQRYVDLKSDQMDGIAPG